MSDPVVFDVDIWGGEQGFLEELAADLQGTFLLLAYTDHADDTDYIRKTQQQFTQRYESFLPYVDSDVGTLRLLPAFDVLMELDPRVGKVQIAEEARDCLAGYLRVGELEVELKEGDPFASFYEREGWRF